MSRLIDTESVGKQRNYLMKAIMLTMRELAPRQDVDDESRDMAAFIALCLEEIHGGIDATVAAWEKRNYWVKADNFRREWSWTGETGRQLRWAVLHNDWSEVAYLMPQIAARLSNVKLPKRNTVGRAWQGAYRKLRTEGMSPS